MRAAIRGKTSAGWLYGFKLHPVHQKFVFDDALVFPVIASFYWKKVTNRAFTVSVLAALAVFLPVRFEWIPLSGVVGIGVDVLSVVGIGVVLGLMTFGFFGLRPALVVGAIASVASAPFVIGFLHDYATLSGSLVAYAVSTLICWALSARSEEDFDFAEIEQLQRTGQWERSGELLADAARKLEGAGAELVLLCTNTMHKVAAAVETAVPIPFLHIADATAAAITQAGVRRVGLLGTRFTMDIPKVAAEATVDGAPERRLQLQGA